MPHISHRIPLFFLIILLASACQNNTPPQHTFCDNLALPAPDAAYETIIVRIQAVRWNCVRAHLPAVAAGEQQLPINVQTEPQEIEIIQFETNQDTFLLGDIPPDITVTRHLEDWVETSNLASLEDCRNRHPQFNQIPDWLWSSATVNGEIYGIPLDVHLALIFYNKNLLRELGWAEAEISTLSQRITSGEFTIEDLFKTAQHAIEQGVVEPGFGYWWDSLQGKELSFLYYSFSQQPYQFEMVDLEQLSNAYHLVADIEASGIGQTQFPPVSHNLWSNDLVRRDAIAQQNVLFWHSTTTSMVNLWYDFPTVAGEMFDHFGTAPWPSAVAGRPASWRIRPNYYVVFNEQATGRQTQDLACDVLAATVTPELNAWQAETAMSFGAIGQPEQHEAFANHPLIELMSLFDPTRAHASEIFPNHAVPILLDYAAAVEQGEQTPEMAASHAMEHLNTMLATDGQ